MRSVAFAAGAAAAAAQGCAPQQFFVSFGNTPDQATVSWATTCSSSTTVKWGTSATALTHSATGNQSTYTFNGGAYTSPFLHHVPLAGLPANTRVYYSVGGDASGFSGVMAFTTHPGYGLNPAGASRFCVIGDLGQTSNSQDTLNHIAASPNNFTSMIHVGDLSYADNYEPRWDSWQQMVAPLAQGLPWMTVVGNHEIELDSNLATFEAYKARFPMPAVYYGTPQQSQQLHYSFKASGVHWLMLSSYTDFDASSVQYAWLQAELATVDRSVTPWLIAVVHAPWYNSNYAHQGEGEPMRVAVEPLLYAAGVDMVFAGHVHAYERSARLYNNAPDAKGPYFITIGDGGNREGLATDWQYPQPSWSNFRMASYGHGELQVLNATHLHWTWHQNPDLEPVVADQFYVIKGQSAEAPLAGSPAAGAVKAGAKMRGAHKAAAKAGKSWTVAAHGGVTAHPVFAGAAKME